MENKTSIRDTLNKNGNTVLVTGGSGFIATHCILQLLEKGYQVRTTIRSVNRADEVLSTLKEAGATRTNEVSFTVTDLMSEQNWREAMSGCDFVLHVASPFPSKLPKNENDIIVPAVEGSLRVLRFARDASVKRVVVTSSFAAIGYGQDPSDKPLSEKNWTNPDKKNITAYVKSKTLAEKAAWDFVAREGGSMELSVVNPVGVLGPVLNKDLSTSIQVVKYLIDGAIPGCPNLSFGFVDVRDVADLHIRAMTSPNAKGERFLAVAGECMTMQEVAILLKKRLGEAGKRIPTNTLPNWIVRIVALFDSSIAQIVPELGHIKILTNEKSKNVLGWTPRTNEEAIISTAESLIRLGLVKKSGKSTKSASING
jgi:nucleoside-diphosphate-sugar epimerase